MGVNELIQIGSRIKDLRKSKTTLSQKDMAKELGIPVSTYSGYENNHREPSSKILNQIATILGVSLDCLLGIDLTSEELTAFVADSLFSVSGFEIDFFMKDGKYKITNYDENYYYYANQNEVDGIINNAAGLMAYELEKLGKTRKIFYEDIDPLNESNS